MTKRKRKDAWVPPPAILRELEREGAFDGATKSQARFNGLLSRVLGVTPPPMTAATADLLKRFDNTARAFAEAHGIELRADDEDPADAAK